MFEWTERWSVGVDTIDAQHRELFAAINSLLREEEKPAARDVVKVLDYLEDYVNNHFGLEEIYMHRLSYPGFPFHKGEHVAFINDFYDLRDEYDDNGATPELASHASTRLARCGSGLSLPPPIPVQSATRHDHPLNRTL